MSPAPSWRGFDVDDLVLDVDDQAHGLRPTPDDHVRRALPRAASSQTQAPSSVDRGHDLAAEVEHADDALVGERHRCELRAVEDLLNALDVDADEQPAHPEGAVARPTSCGP